MFSEMRPSEYASDPYRIATIAVAIERAQITLAPKWGRDPRLLGAALATAVIKESGTWESVHSGEKRGGAGEICLVQIHPTNRKWVKAGAPSFESLGGVGPQSTEWCILSGAHSLVDGSRFCSKRKYRTKWALAMWTMYHYGSRCWISPGAKGRTQLMQKIATTPWKPTTAMVDLVESVYVDFEKMSGPNFEKMSSPVGSVGA
jgi:hypothetical protein